MPERFVGSSPKQVPYEPPPVEILEAATLSIGMYLEQFKNHAPVYVANSAMDFVASLQRWAEEIKHPPQPELVLGANANVQALAPIVDATAAPVDTVAAPAPDASPVALDGNSNV